VKTGVLVTVAGPEPAVAFGCCVDCAGVVVACVGFVLGFGGTGFGFSPGIDEAAPTAVIWTCCAPLTLVGEATCVAEAGWVAVLLLVALPIAYAAPNTSTAAATTAMSIRTPGARPAPPTDVRF
jgi:hypothetical protein